METEIQKKTPAETETAKAEPETRTEEKAETRAKAETKTQTEEKAETRAKAEPETRTEEKAETRAKTETATRAAEKTEERSKAGSTEEETAQTGGKVKKNPTNMILIILIILLALAGAGALLLLRKSLSDNEVSFQGEAWYQTAAAQNREPLSDTLSGQEAFATLGGSGDGSLAESWAYGNEMQLYARGALLAMDEEYYYAANELDGCRLYRISRDGAYRREKISDIPAEQISLLDGRLYFVSGFGNASNASGIYSVGTDGTRLEYMSDVVPEYMMLVNDWLYYLNEGDDHIYKMNIADRREVRLSEQSCVSMTMHENTIFFSYLTDAEDGDSPHVLAAMDVDGNAYRELAGDGYFNNIMYVDGKIYYVSYEDEQFCSIGADGTGAAVIGTADLASGLQVCDGNCYFVDNARGRAISVYQESSGDVRTYNLENVRNFFLFDGKIYVNYLDGAQEKVSVHSLADGKLILFLE